MANPKPADFGAPESALDLAKETPRTYDPRKRVYVRDVRTGRKYPAPVPENHLAIFPHLREVASKKEGK